MREGQHHHQQSASRELGLGIRRHCPGDGHPGPPAPPQPRHLHLGRELSVARKRLSACSAKGRGWIQESRCRPRMETRCTRIDCPSPPPGLARRHGKADGLPDGFRCAKRAYGPPSGSTGNAPAGRPPGQQPIHAPGFAWKTLWRFPHPPTQD